MKPFYRVAVAVLSILPLAAGHPAAGQERFAHEGWTKVLSRFVDEKGFVDYDALMQDRADFDQYIGAIEKRSPRSHPDLFRSRNDKLAYYLNAYNAQVFKGVLARGPEKESVWKGGLFSGYSFFVGMKIVLGGETTSLKTLEDKWVREGFKDPRVHAALNCASRSCPRLPQKAFDPDNLDQELDAGMREFVGDNRNCAIDEAAKTVALSKIFDWFSSDFINYEKSQGDANGNQIDYVNRYRGELPKVPREYRIKFFDYDKGINRQKAVSGQPPAASYGREAQDCELPIANCELRSLGAAGDRRSAMA